MDFYERYARCCKEQGILPASQAAAEQIGCARSNISTFAKTHNTPKGDIVAGAAKMLNVSADYLLGLIDTPGPIDNALTQAEMTVLSLFRELNEAGQKAAIAMLTGLAAQKM